MYPFVVAASVFVALVIAALGSLPVSEHLPAHYRDDETHNVVRLTANIVVVTTSLVLGLLLKSAKNSFARVDRNVHALATDIVLLDRWLIAIVAAWLVMIFASFGYRAPANAVVVATLVIAAFLISGSLYLLLDTDSPFPGAIQVQPGPLEMALRQISR